MDDKITVWTVYWKMNKIGFSQINESQTFTTFTSALSFARQLSSEIDISQCLGFMRNDNSLLYQRAMADLIEKVIVKCGFLDYKEDIPSLDPKGYANSPCIETKTKSTDTNNDFSITYNDRYVNFKYLRHAEHKLKTSVYFLSEHPEKLSLLTLFRFGCENESILHEGDISFLEIILERKKKKVCSSGKYSIKHSVQILELLRKSDKPLRICDIVELTGIRDRRTIMRNISKLIDSGFDIGRDENKGYYIPKAKEILTSKDMQLIRESIDLNCRISPEEKERLMQLLLKI
jgi:biotin operon repressor